MSAGAPRIPGDDAEFTRDAQERWEQGASIYDERRRRSRSRWYLALERRVYRRLVAGAGAVSRILDAGCGTGELSAFLATLAPVVSVDLSVGSIRLLRRRRPALPALVGDITRMPVRAASVDLAVSNIVLSHLPDPMIARALAEIHVALRPGGTLAFTVFNWDGVRRFGKAFPAARGHFPSGVYYRAFTLPEVAELMAATPFRDVRVRGLGLFHALTQPRRGLHRLYRLLGWATIPVEELLQRRLGLLRRVGTYLLIVGRK